MRRRTFLGTIPPALSWPAECHAQASRLPPKALPEPHFPSRLYQFVWRNWELANLDRMAQVVRATPPQLASLAAQMGLPRKRPLGEDYLRRIYITVIRQNWHLLPAQQIIELLGWTEERFKFTLKEDDFLDVKLGVPQPEVAPLRYGTPSRDEIRRAGEIKAALRRLFPGGWKDPGQPRLAFVRDFDSPEPKSGWQVSTTATGRALTAALKRFAGGLASGGQASGKQGSGRQVSVEVDAASGLGPGDYRIVPSAPGVRIQSATERGAIRGLYALQGHTPWPTSTQESKEVWTHRFLYSYFALYGDPLMEGDAAGLPDGYLDRAAANGINGVWIQGVLHNLAPAPAFPEFGKDWEIRIRNLQKLVVRADSFGLKVYLYLNEPRAMPAEFFANRPSIRGTAHQGVYAMCTSAPQVRDWLRQSVSHVFGHVPSLGGVFTITMSENHTNCFSHGGAWGDRNPVAKDCPRCSPRSGADTIAEFIQTIRDGVREHSQTAEVMSYDWGWGTPLAQALIPKLPKDTSVISISEWSQPVSRGGVNTIVGEYSISVVGPGPRASANWKLAREHGVAAVAKTQFNNTWEISAVPYIPVLSLVVEHCERLAKSGISGVMASWTCGGFPGSNLRAASAFAFEPRPSASEILRAEAERIYGEANAGQALAAWKVLSEAFQHFPYGVAIYILPLQHGPANPLRLTPANLRPGMLLFPYDAYKAWSGAYPPAVVQSQMAKLATRWAEGVALLERIGARNAQAALELAIARTCQYHFESTANQVEFYLLRDEAPAAGKERRTAIRERMIEIAQRERELARLQYEVASKESLIGYEASNHYYYTPLDLIEKILNCDQVIATLRHGA